MKFIKLLMIILSQCILLRKVGLCASLNWSCTFPVFKISPVYYWRGRCFTLYWYTVHLQATLCELRCKITKKYWNMEPT